MTLIIQENSYLESEDYQALVSWIHKLAPNFVMVGMPAFTHRFKETEVELKQSGALKGYEQDVSVLLKDLAGSRSAVEKLNEELS